MRRRSLFFLLLLLPATLSATTKTDTSDLYRGLETFTKALYHIEKEYADLPDNQRLIYGAIHGMLATLDPHSMFLPPEAYRELKVDTQGWFGGIGIEITVQDNHPIVVAPIEGSPAERAGIRAGDRIVKIDGMPVKGMTLLDIVQHMRGLRGSRLTLTVIPKDSKVSREVTILREIIHIRSVRSNIPEPGYGYIKINSFQEGTAKEMEKSLRSLEKEGMKGLILDMRNNPGGLLDEAVEVSDKFLDKGVIVTTASRGRELDRRVAHEEGMERHYPIVVLVNEGSASAAEIVAAALQDNHRALLLGNKTFGKGSVQTILELGNDAAIKLTVAKYFTPNGRSIQGRGVLPDIVIAKKEPETKPAEETETKEPTPPDPEVQKALDLLKEGAPSSHLKQSKKH